ncbi:hypothetical protein CN692_24140 [Bacillus sp. AFS002410]|uniref:hypothetical protein n=1 Tax=Bacillus sp. AFS002410 TaxID=2033481 RepID=UPI000BF1FEDE|nr:hypothetical protein [Bacillus sp. AFS002410]PEJ48201.1 hypothetical protein CN692_24140 [Bacillus sp. AFS002410]
MSKRDKQIISIINKFKCLDRDDVIKLFFLSKKNPISNCNTVLRRLTDRGYIKQSKRQIPALYFSTEKPIKETSQKIPHFRELFKVYITLKHYLGTFEVEPKLGPQGVVEPDAFMIFNKTPFFVEVQLTFYNKKLITEKIKRYESYFHSNEWVSFPWQKKESSPFFPYIVIFTDKEYEIDSFLQVIQFKSASELLINSNQEVTNNVSTPSV